MWPCAPRDNCWLIRVSIEVACFTLPRWLRAHYQDQTTLSLEVEEIINFERLISLQGSHNHGSGYLTQNKSENYGIAMIKIDTSARLGEPHMKIIVVY